MKSRGVLNLHQIKGTSLSPEYMLCICVSYIISTVPFCWRGSGEQDSTDSNDNGNFPTTDRRAQHVHFIINYNNVACIF